MKPIHDLTDDELLQRIRDAAALPDAPPKLISNVIAMMAKTRTSTLMDTARATLHSVVAALTFDSWTSGSLAYGVRGVPSDVRHLLYSALGRDVDVRVSPSAGAFVVDGQVLGPDETGSIEMMQIAGTTNDGSPTYAKVCELDSMGQFRIEGIPVGEYILRVRLGEEEISLPPIDLGERRA